jgi:hypothetical protein
MALIRCILDKFLGVVCHCFPPRLEVPTFAARCLHVLKEARDPSSERWKYGREMSGNIAHMTSQFTPLGIFYMPQIRHGTDGFTAPPKEGVLRIFSLLKIRRLRPGLNPRIIQQILCTTTCFGQSSGRHQVKVKVSCNRPEQAQVVPDRSKPWIFLTFGTTTVVVREPYAPAAFTPGEIPGTHF